MLAALVALAALLVPAAAGVLADETPPYRVVDTHGRPLGGAHVSVVGWTGSVITDSNGEFRLLFEPTPPFELAVFDARGTLLGVVQVPSVIEPGSRDLVLSPVPQEKVTVLSGAAPSTIAPPAAAASIFSSTENRERRPAQLFEALEGVPGTSQVGSGPAAVPSLRGLARGRTLLLLDDARVTAERRAGPSATYLNPFSLESVEIVRGPGSVTYGSDALGGIIHARTPVPRTGELSGRYEASAGTGEPTASAAFELNVPVGAAALLAQGYIRDTEDYDSPTGVVPNSGSRTHGALLRGFVPAGKTRLLFGLQFDRGEDIGKPVAEPGGERTSYPTEDSDRLNFAAEFPAVAGFSGLELRAFLGSYRLVTDRETTAGTTRTTERADVHANDAMVRVVGTRPLQNGMLRVGMDLTSRFDLRARDLVLEQQAGGPQVLLEERESIESARRSDGGLFAEVVRTLPGPGGSLSAGLRGDRVATSSRGESFGRQSTSEEALSGYLAASIDIGKHGSATLQYARGFRDARLSDRYFQGVTGRGTIIGNPDLIPETSDQFDLALRAKRGPLRLALFGYLYRVDDLIERFELPGQPRVFSFRNRGEVELRGVELESDVELPRGLELRIALNRARGTILDDDTPAADVPAPSATLSLRQRIGERHWWRLHYKLFGRDDEPGSTEAETPGYTVIDASAGFYLGAGLEARVYLGNLLDKRYPSSSADDAPLAPGRSASVVLAGKF